MLPPSPPRGMSATQIHDARTDYSTVPDELRAEIARLQAENERLKKSKNLINQLYALSMTSIVELKNQLRAAEALAAERLADQEAIERRVARECHQIAASSEYGYQAAERIRARYGLEG